MTNDKMDQSITENVSELIHSIRKELNQLSVDDLGTVKKSITAFVAKEIEQHPFRTMASAFVIGFGLGKLGKTEVKSAVAQVAKLVSLRTLSKLGDHTTAASSAVH